MSFDFLCVLFFPKKDLFSHQTRKETIKWYWVKCFSKFQFAFSMEKCRYTLNATVRTMRKNMIGQRNWFWEIGRIWYLIRHIYFSSQVKQSTNQILCAIAQSCWWWYLHIYTAHIWYYMKMISTIIWQLIDKTKVHIDNIKTMENKWIRSRMLITIDILYTPQLSAFFWLQQKDWFVIQFFWRNYVDVEKYISTLYIKINP